MVQSRITHILHFESKGFRGIILNGDADSAHVCVCVWVCVRVCVHVCVYFHVFVCMGVCISMCLCACECVRVCVNYWVCNYYVFQCTVCKWEHDMCVGALSVEHASA